MNGNNIKKQAKEAIRSIEIARDYLNNVSKKATAEQKSFISSRVDQAKEEILNLTDKPKTSKKTNKVDMFDINTTAILDPSVEMKRISDKVIYDIESVVGRQEVLYDTERIITVEKVPYTVIDDSANRQLTAVNAQLIANNTQLTTDNNQLTTVNTQLTNDNTQLVVDVDTRDVQIAALTAQITHLQTKIKQLEDDASVLNIEITRLQDEIKNKTAVMSTHQGSITTITRERDTLIAQKATWLATEKKLNDQINQLQAEKNIWETVDKPMLENQIKTMQVQLTDLKTTNDQAMADLKADHKNKITNIKTEYDTKIINLDKEYKDEELKLILLQDQKIQELKTLYDSKLQGQSTNVVSGQDDSKITGLNMDIANLKAEIARLRKQCDQRVSAVEQERIMRETELKQQYETETKKLRQANIGKSTQIKNDANQINILKNSVKSLNESHAASKNQIEKMTAAVKLRDAEYEAKLKFLQEELDKKPKEVIVNDDAKIASLNEQIYKLQEELKQNEKSLEEITRRYEQYKTKTGELSSELHNAFEELKIANLERTRYVELLENKSNNMEILYSNFVEALNSLPPSEVSNKISSEVLGLIKILDDKKYDDPFEKEEKKAKLLKRYTLNLRAMASILQKRMDNPKKSQIEDNELFLDLFNNVFNNIVEPNLSKTPPGTPRRKDPISGGADMNVNTVPLYMGLSATLMYGILGFLIFVLILIIVYFAHMIYQLQIKPSKFENNKMYYTI